MCVSNEEQASRFLERVCQHQQQLTVYACSLTKCSDKAHDLYSDTLLKCYERIATHGFHREAYVPYLITAIKLNFYHERRERVDVLSLEDLHNNAADESTSEEEHQSSLALYTGILSFVSAHFTADEAAIFELHVNGLTYPEIVFSTGSTYWRAVQLVRRIKLAIRKNFGYKL